MSLTEEQQAVVETELPKVKVISAAGSGKTTVLVNRISHLVCDIDVAPGEIMAITFTRRAGKELQNRLPPSCQGVHVGTFHSILLRWMPNPPNVLSESEADELLDKCAAQLGLSVNGEYRRKSRAQYKKEISAIRAGKAEPSDLFNLYVSKLAINGDVDYDGILVRGVELAQEGRLGSIRYLMVDEAQDNEPMQWAMIDAMEAHGTQVMAVGDIGQSMYSFRGAVPKEFERRPYETLQLSQSFRFSNEIAKAANKTKATTLEVWSKKEGPGPKIHKTDPAKLAQYLTKSGWDASDVAILCRYNQTVEQVRSSLLELGIPAVTPKVKLTGPIHDLLVYLSSTGSSTSRERLKSWSGARPKIIEWIVSDINLQSCSEICKNWLGQYKTVREVVTNLETPPHMDLERQNILYEFADLSLGEYKAEAGQQEFIAEGQGVTVGTIHWSKGGEWPAVIVCGLDKGRWPRGKASDEEWRIFYVAMTRAIDELYLTYEGEPNEFVERVRE